MKINIYGELMTDENWNHNDYLVDFPDTLYTGTQVDKPIFGKTILVREHLDNIFFEINNCVRIDAELAALTLSLSTVDYLAGFHYGKQSTGKAYIGFLNSYFPEKYKPYNENIYSQIRCGLFHNLAAINPFNHKNIAFRFHTTLSHHLELFFDEVGFQILNFSIPIFVEDLRRASYMFLYDVVMMNEEKPMIKLNFEKRFNKCDGRGAGMVKSKE